MTALVSGSPPRVVIIGSGFAGFFAAGRLINADVDLTLAGDIGCRKHSMRRRGVAVVDQHPPDVPAAVLGCNGNRFRMSRAIWAVSSTAA